MLSWRDPWHPRGGGAEILTLRILERLARDYGYDVEWFSASYPGAPSREKRNGIEFVRKGSQITVQAAAFRRYKTAPAFDVVIDQINTLPFYTPFYVKTARLLFIMQLAREVWLYEAPRLVGLIGYAVEPLMLRPYRRTPTITISRSTEQSLREIGLSGDVRIIPMATDEQGESVVPPKAEANDIIVMGRVTPSKRVEHSIQAASILRKMGWTGSLHIAGGGPENYVKKLKDLAQSHELSNIVFHGRVSNVRRRELLSNARLLWMTSAREGWGLVVNEAGQHWTPAVVYDAPGLRDSVKSGVTGIVTSADPSDLASQTWSLLNDRDRLQNYAQAAREDAMAQSWDKTAAEFHAAVKDFTHNTPLTK